MINDFSTEEFKEKYHYEGKLGITYSKDKTVFSLWSPLATKVDIELYREGNDGQIIDTISMNKYRRGVWIKEITNDCHGLYYVYNIYFGKKVNKTVDPYAIALGANGRRAMIIDLERTNPEGWVNDKKPELKDFTDSIIYEAHIRDLSIDENSGVEVFSKGKFKGLIEEGTVIPNTNIKTTLDHIKELGITHIHLLPAFDYGSVDEEKLEVPQFNWGYDPTNYNVPEGSYSTNPFDGEIRIKEFKEMIQGFHKNGIRVVMDVVYNHTFSGEDSNLNLSMPGYYHRQDKNGNFSNGSGCGNELASERSMVRKYIIDSLTYWAEEYHIDGFRFDLMALHDIETLKLARQRLDNIDKSIIIYGEGWNGGESQLPEEIACFKKNTRAFDSLQIAAFSDDIRDGIKGNVIKEDEPGFVNGKTDFEETIKFGVVASTRHNDINYNKINYSSEPWANEPYQTITYCSAHDNNTLWDKLQIISKNATKEEIIKENKLAAAIVLVSQGISFIHAGEEFARTKIDENGEFVENSYASSDEVNKINWNRKIEYMDLFNYYKGLIKLRKNNKIFRLNSNKEIQEYISFFKEKENFQNKNIVAFEINSKGNLQGWNNIVVVFNGSNSKEEIKLPDFSWDLVVNENKAGVDTIKEIRENKIIVPGKSCYVMVKKSKNY